LQMKNYRGFVLDGNRLTYEKIYLFFFCDKMSKIVVAIEHDHLQFFMEPISEYVPVSFLNLQPFSSSSSVLLSAVGIFYFLFVASTLSNSF
jgi:hypothetical protein